MWSVFILAYLAFYVDYTVTYFLPILSIVALYQSEIWVAQRPSRTAPCRGLYSSTFRKESKYNVRPKNKKIEPIQWFKK
jgi:hypothetical protein